MLKNRGIGTKISIGTSTIILVVLAVITFLSYTISSQSMEAENNTNLQSLAKADADILSKQLQIYKNDVALTASRARIQSLDWNQQKPVLESDTKEFGFSSMAFADVNGTLTKTDGSSAAVSDRDYFKAAMNGEIFISNPEIGRTTGKLVVHIAAPVKDSSGTIKGVVVGIADGQFISRLVKDMKGSASGNGFVVDGTGTVIGDQDASIVSSQKNFINEAQKDKSFADMGAFFSQMIARKNGIGQYTYKGAERYVAYAQISGTSWILGVVAIKSEVMAGVNLLKNLSIIITIISIIVSALLCILLIRVLVTRPLKKAVHMIQELSKGHLKERLSVKSNDEVGRMSAAMNALADTLQFNIMGSLKQIRDGDMSVKIESKDENDEIAPVVKETAETVKSIVSEVRDIIEAVDAGNLDKRCDDSAYKGDWKLLAQRVNSLCDSVSAPIEEARYIMGKMSVNDYTEKMEGHYDGVFKSLSDDINTVRERLLAIQDNLVKTSKGNTEGLAELESIGKRSENDHMIPAEIAMMRNIELLINEVNRLSEEAVNGNIINVRGDEKKFEGGYRKIIEGFNATLDAISAPMSEVLTILENMSVNNFTQKIEGKYEGDFEKLTNALGEVLGQLLYMQDIAVKISNGDITELNSLRDVGKLSEYDQIIPAFVGMMESIQHLIDEATQIAGNAAQGKLDIRGRADMFNGGYADIINAINSFLDAVEAPTNKIMDVMNAIAAAKFGETIDGEFHGQFKVLVDSVNATSMQLQSVIQKITDTITLMANGDFSMDTIEDYKGDFVKISDALNMILVSLNELFGNVSQTADQVASGSMQVSQGSQALSQGATEQASTVEELAASIAEISSQTDKNAIDASKANNLMVNVKTSAEDGSDQMQEMLKSMDDIAESSRNIAKIIKIIDDIAFQTNILSLNAAVEAARAGQHGKGFAVVAEEVRNLATRSANAAKEITSLIENTAGKIENGTKIADSTAETFKGIVDGVENIAELLSSIATASKEQAVGISQINTGLGQVSAVVQTNSATAEESAAASEELSSQAAILKDSLSKFVLRAAEN